MSVEIRTSFVAAIDAQGCEVAVERHTVVVHRDGLPPETVHRYHYDHSHVREEASGVLLVLATGDRLRLCEA